MAAGIFCWSKGSKPIEQVKATGFPPADASVDDVRAWAGTLHADPSKIVAALDGLDGTALRDELLLRERGLVHVREVGAQVETAPVAHGAPDRASARVEAHLAQSRRLLLLDAVCSMEHAAREIVLLAPEHRVAEPPRLGRATQRRRERGARVAEKDSLGRNGRRTGRRVPQRRRGEALDRAGHRGRFHRAK